MEQNFDNNQRQTTPPPLYGANEAYSAESTGRRDMSAISTRALFNNVFLWMFGALLVTALTALAVVHTPLMNVPTMTVCIIAELVLVFVLSARIGKMSFTTATVMMVLYSVLNGVTLSIIFAVYTMPSIATTFFIAAGMFGVMVLVGATTKRNLSPIYRYLIMTLVGLILVSLVNIFLGNETIDFIISAVGVVLFVILTAVDTNRIKKMIAEYNGVVDNETIRKIALMGALSLYLDFINLFLYLLRFFGRNN